jgi:hypothetical protein
MCYLWCNAMAFSSKKEERERFRRWPGVTGFPTTLTVGLFACSKKHVSSTSILFSFRGIRNGPSYHFGLPRSYFQLNNLENHLMNCYNMLPNVKHIYIYIYFKSLKGSSIEWRPRLMKRRSLVWISSLFFVWTRQKI